MIRTRKWGSRFDRSAHSCLVALVLAAAVQPVALSAESHCKLGEMAEFPITMRGLRPLMTAGINGTDVQFVLDSGAFYSTLSPASASELKLETHYGPFGFYMQGAGGGRADVSIATVKTFTLAGVPLKNVDFLVGGTDFGSGSVGLLGQNILHLGDVEYDLGNGVVRLMKPIDCRNTVLAYWANASTSYSVLSIDAPNGLDRHTGGTAYVNGAEIRVEFDTGAGSSVLSLRAAARAGVKPDSPGVVYAGDSYGIGKTTYPTYIAPFGSFKIGDEEIKNTKLRIGDIDLPNADMLLGPDFFLSHHIYVASSQRKLYFTYNGGPVFNLTSAPNAKAAGGSNSNPPAPADAAPPTRGVTSDTTGAAPPTIPGSEGEPTTAEALARRGTAFAARRDFEHAIADLSRACELAPQESRYFFERAQAYQNNKQPALANADIDEVLALKPDDVPALMWRARRYLNGHNRQGAIADLDTVDHLEPPQADLRLDLGILYAGANELPQAISQYNLWIKAHDSDVRLANAYNARCWAQAWLGTALDQGMSDCNKAIRVTADNPVTLESRALVRLRMDDFDHAIADYSAALKLQPRSAV